MKNAVKKMLAAALAIVVGIAGLAMSVFATEEESAIVTGDINIGTAEELLAFAKSTQDGTNGNCKDLTVALTADIDMTGYYWYHRDSEGTVVADYRIPDFIGTFEGNGYKIQNLSFLDAYADTTEMSNLSFIIQGKSYLKNLHLDGITVDTAAPAYFAGLVKDFAWSGDASAYAENCSVSNVVIDAAADFTFGGMFYRLVGGSHITDCHVRNVTVNAKGALVGDNSGRNGGFVATGCEPMTLTGCTVTGLTVYAESTSKYLGGFIGGASMSAKFYDCAVDGFTVVAGDKISVVGGFVGYTAGSAWGSGLIMENCSVKGLNVECDARISAAGGFIGYTYGQGKSLTDGAHNFTNCTAEGSISAGADSKVGGFIGWLYGRSGGCAANFVDCAAKVNVVSGSYGAGFVGYYVPYSTNTMYTSFENCTASGDVTATEPVGSFLNQDETIVGGIIGGTYNYDPENADETTGETNNVAPGYRALDNGDGTWTVFPDLGREVVTIHFHRWNDETASYENWRSVEVFKDTCFLDPAHNNENNATHPAYRFLNGNEDGIADGLAELNREAGSVERPFTFWTDAPDGLGEESLTDSTVITEDRNVYVAVAETESELTPPDIPLNPTPDKDGDPIFFMMLVMLISAVLMGGCATLKRKAA